MLHIWIGFIISLAWILIVSRKNLSLAIITGAIILGFFTLPPRLVLDRIIYTLTDSSILLLALAMGVIPVIGGTMKEGGHIDSLVDNLRISKRYMMAFSSALMGLLPMPGGALLSAPILEKVGEDVDNKLKSAINVWFRHIFILIYPLSVGLIASAKISGLDVYEAIVYLLPGFLSALVLGYIFFLRKVHGKILYNKKFSWSALAIPLFIILSAPVIDFTFKRLFSIGNAATLIGVIVALCLSIILSKKRLDIKRITVQMKPWNFALIIIGMFMYLHIFQVSDAKNLFSTLPLPPLTLAVTTGSLLGFLTGRVQLPASIIFPVYLSSIGHITPFLFSLIYIAIFFGYVISPVHLCLVVTCGYFHISIKDLTKEMILPTLITLVTVLLLSLVVV